jgi:hypothetical protein
MRPCETNRSANAIAFGVRKGVFRISVPVPLNTSSKLATYLVSRSRTDAEAVDGGRDVGEHLFDRLFAVDVDEQRASGVDMSYPGFARRLGQ